MRVFFAILGAVFLLGATAVISFLVWRNTSPASGHIAEPAVQALVAPRFADVDALAIAALPSCASHPDQAPSPAIGTPIVGWPETRGVEVLCHVAAPPGSGPTPIYQFEDWGDTSMPTHADRMFGRSGTHDDDCDGYEADCVVYWYASIDPTWAQIEASRHDPSTGDWISVRVVLAR